MLMTTKYTQYTQLVEYFKVFRTAVIYHPAALSRITAAQIQLKIKSRRYTAKLVVLVKISRVRDNAQIHTLTRKSFISILNANATFQP